MITTQQGYCANEAVGHSGKSESAYRTNIRSRAEVPGILDRLTAAMAVHRCSAREVFAVRLALEEAIVNAIHHGNRDDPLRHVRVSYLVRADYILMEVEDQGEGFDPKTIPDPLDQANLERSSGRGLLLLRYYMTWVRFNDKG